MKLSIWIAWRYLLSNKTGHFGRLLSGVAISGIAVGILALIVVLSVMRGFNEELTRKLLGFNSHLTVEKLLPSDVNIDSKEVVRIIGEDRVVEVSPFVEGEVIAKSFSTGQMLAQGARVRGVDSKKLGSMKGMNYVFGGKSYPLEEFSFGENAQNPDAIIGNDMVLQLSIHPSFADEIELVAPLASLSYSGELIPNKRSYKVSGIFKSGLYDFDAKYVLVGLDEAKRLLGEQAREGLRIKLTNIDDIKPAEAKLKEAFGDSVKIRSLNEHNSKLFAALKLERIAMSAVLVMAILISSFTISGIVLLVTSSKRKDVGILSSMGFSHRQIIMVFVMYAIMIGMVGSFIGLVASSAICYFLQASPISLPESYYLDYLPVNFHLLWALFLSLVGVLVAGLAAVYPTLGAMRYKIVELLRYE